MTVYMQSSNYSVHVGQTGHTHVRDVPNDPEHPEQETPMAIDCVVCEPFLVREGAVYDPVLVPLTDRQQRERDRVEREGNYAMQRAANSLADAAARVVTEARPRRVSRRVRSRS